MSLDIFPAGIPLSKRVFDLICAFLGLVILSPFLLLVSIIILTMDGWPIFFLQLRPGFRAKLFRMIKFRTMDVSPGEVSSAGDAGRITRLGRLLRTTSIDEWPQLFNILRGEMSLVGPRPLLVQYLDRYTPEQARRHDVLPGLTGWAQVNGRNSLSWEEKFRLDIWYVDHWSFGLDLRILWMSIKKVLKREGISREGAATIEEFKGE
jgi:lipopolysaccharide/colanic/teichoic acid biosynthesis glycosyltransferase